MKGESGSSQAGEGLMAQTRPVASASGHSSRGLAPLAKIVLMAALGMPHAVSTYQCDLRKPTNCL